MKLKHKEVVKLIEELGRKRGSFVVPLLMDETRSISRYMVSLVYEKLEGHFSKEGVTRSNVDVIIHSSGGDADAAYHLSRILQEYCGEEHKLAAIIPRFAKSAATLLACGCDAIAMGPPSELGPIDPQIEDPSTGMWLSASSISTMIEMMKKIERGPLLEEFVKKIPVMAMGDFERVRDHTEELVQELLVNRMFKGKAGAEDKAKEISETLAKGYKFHGKAITMWEAKKLGLEVEEMPKEQWTIVWKIFRTFEEEVLLSGGEA